MNIYHANICKHEHEENMTRLGYVIKLCLKLVLTKLKETKDFIFIYSPLET
jgi:hypothetical protein